MLDVLLLRLDAPLISFGGTVVDSRGVVQGHPPLSLITGMLANALGYHHGDTHQLAALQSRLRLAARRDRSGTRIMDFQTVDLGQDFMSQPGWTTRGHVEERAGGSARTGTHIRGREYLADSVFTVALALRQPFETPTFEDLAAALDAPARPLFIGRKCCLPSTPILLGRARAAFLLEALRNAPAIPPERRERADVGILPAWWPADEDEEGDDGMLIAIVDERDWSNQIHSGRRLLRQGQIVLSDRAQAVVES